MEYDFNFNTWTSLEMFFYLIDIKEIPFDAKFEDWKYLKEDMLRMCLDNYKEKHDTRSTEN